MNNTKPPKPPLWAYIEQNLDRLGLTTGDLARALGVTRSCLTGWRRGKSLNLDTARALARVFQTSVTELLVSAEMITPDEAAIPDRTITLVDFTSKQLIGELAYRLRVEEQRDRMRPSL